MTHRGFSIPPLVVWLAARREQVVVPVEVKRVGTVLEVVSKEGEGEVV